VTDNLSGEQVTYTYDQLNRLTQAMTNDAWGLSFSYDGFGNLTQQTRVQGTTPPSMSVTVDPGTNRITTAGYGYDANGNVTQTPDGMTYSYDGANRMVSNGSAYNPRNQRVWDGTYLYYYGVRGELIGKYQALWGYITTVNGVAYTTVLLQGGQTNLYFNGRALRLQGHGSYVMTDRLGSVRVNGNGQRMNYYPYGAEVGTETAEGRVKFGTYTRDSAGVDYAEQRYYGVGTGRFNTPDPYTATATSPTDPSDPGSWNRYAYVGGDPINSYDPTGQTKIDPDSTVTPGGGNQLFCYWDSVPGPEGIIMRQFCQIQPVAGRPKTAEKTNPICDSKILQAEYLDIFAGIGKDLKVDPAFIMAVALQESGWNLKHVYETNPSSNGQPLNNLFGSTYGGANNIAYPSVQASANAWENNWGKFLTDPSVSPNPNPTTIGAFVKDLLSNPSHMYNANVDWPTSIEGGTWQTNKYGIKGQSTIGTYRSVQKIFKLCDLSF